MTEPRADSPHPRTSFDALRKSAAALIAVVAALAGCSNGSDATDRDQAKSTDSSTSTLEDTKAGQSDADVEASSTTQSERNAAGSAPATSTTGSDDVPAGTPNRVEPAPSPGCATGATTGNNAERRTIDISGTERYYLIRSGQGHDPKVPTSLIFNLHGAGSNPEQQLAYGNFLEQQDRDGGVMVLPKSLANAWSPGTPDDPAIIDQLLTEVAAEFCIDMTRVYSTGMSSGGFMTAWLACNRGDKFAAYGMVTANVYTGPGCGAGKPVDAVSFHGTADPIVPFGDGELVNGIATKNMMAGFATQWAQHDGCSSAPVDEKISNEVIARTWADCDPHGSFTFYVIMGGGHTWPGSIPIEAFGFTTDDVSASDIIWDLFQKHRLGD